jgi:parvulin-like peptidyl-prolyl isomerase
MVATVCCWAVIAGAVVANAEAQPPAKRPSEPGERVVAATVDGTPIYVDQVERELAIAAGERPVDPNGRRALLAVALQQLIDRQLILSWLEGNGQRAAKSELDLAVQRLERELQQRGRSLADYCRDLRLNEQDLRAILDWQIAWQRFLDRYLTDENVQRFFQQHQREFDGTRLRVAHLLVKIGAPGDEGAQEEAWAKAAQIRTEIASGRLDFADAARRLSQAPSSADGGDIGFIARHEPMPEPFSRAAFGLRVGDVSQPVITAAGVHLIMCLAVEPGTRTWTDVRADLEQAMTQHLFEWAANRRRPKAQIQITDALPQLPRSVQEVLRPNGNP